MFLDETKIKNRAEPCVRVKAPGGTPQTRCKLLFNQKYQRNKKQNNISVNSVVVNFTSHRTSFLDGEESKQGE